MADGIRIITEDTAVSAKLKAMPEAAIAEIRKVVTADTLRMKSSVLRKVSGEVLHVRSGRLRRSIHERVSELSNAVTGSVATSPDVPYARIQEYGGKVHIPEIVPVRAKALRFEYGGRVVFAQKVRAHDVNIPERSYMRTSLKEIAARFIADMRAIPAKLAKA